MAILYEMSISLENTCSVIPVTEKQRLLVHNPFICLPTFMDPLSPVRSDKERICLKLSRLSPLRVASVLLLALSAGLC